MSQNPNDERKDLDKIIKELNFKSNVTNDNQEISDIQLKSISNEYNAQQDTISNQENIDEQDNIDNQDVIKKEDNIDESQITDNNDDNNDDDIENIVKTETIPSQDVIKENIENDNKFKIDISDDEYNYSDFENEDIHSDYEIYDDYEEDNDSEEPPKKKRRKKTSPLGMFFRIIIAFILVGTLAFCAIAGVYAYGDFSGITGNGINVKVEIPPDTYVSDVGEILKENGIIKYPPIFKAYIKYIYKQDITLHYGKFNLNSSMGYKQLLQVLQNPANSESGIKFTIKEGENIADIAKKLEENHVCTSQEFLDAVANGQFDFPFVNEIPNPQERVYRLEGYLFPDTYTFKQDTAPEEIIRTLLSNFESKFTEQMKYAISISPYSFDEIITLASIIQAEAPTKTDMMKVSSVYRNRLDNPSEYPKLQADPTSKYANRVLLPAGVSEEIANKYDTYKTKGLPLGPINNPGLDAILSAIYPATTNNYYFCSDLTTKQLYYAETYEKHQENLSLAGLSENE